MGTLGRQLAHSDDHEGFAYGKRYKSFVIMVGDRNVSI
jgi:hypothetical protein